VSDARGEQLREDVIPELMMPCPLPVAPRPIAGELFSSWIERIAAANATTAAELLQCVTNCQQIERQDTLLDYRLAPTLRSALAIVCRASDLDVQALELSHQFRNLRPQWLLPGTEMASIPVVKPGICTECIAEQHSAGVPMHLRAEWALAFLTHCPKHLGWLSTSCRNCYSSGAYAFTAGGANLLCARCGLPIPLDFSTGDYGVSTGVGVVVALQAQMQRAARGLPPDPFWLGAISAKHFLLTTNDILHLLTHRKNGQGSILANSLGPREFSIYQPLTQEIEHPPLCSLPLRLRLTLMAALTQFLLGPRSADYFKSAQYAGASEKPRYPLTGMSLSLDEQEFLETRLPFWPLYLRERLSSPLGRMGTRRPQAKAA